MGEQAPGSSQHGDQASVLQQCQALERPQGDQLSISLLPQLKYKHLTQ